MDYEEEIAREILKAARERLDDGKEYPRPRPSPTSTTSVHPQIGAVTTGHYYRTFYRRQLMDMLGIPVTRRWLRRQ